MWKAMRSEAAARLAGYAMEGGTGVCGAFGDTAAEG